MIDALKRASAGSIIAVMPYFGYARQDRKSKPRTPISARLVADLITAAGVDRVLSIDLHAGQIQGFFNIPVDHLYAMPVLMDYLRAALQPARRSSSRPTRAASSARAPTRSASARSLAIIDKRRPAPNVSEVVNIIGDVQGTRRDHRRRHGRHRRHAVRGRAGRDGRRARARSSPAPATACSRRPAIERIMASPLQELHHHRHHPAPARGAGLPEDQGALASRACSARRSSASTTAIRSARCSSERSDARTAAHGQGSERHGFREGQRRGQDAVPARAAPARCAPPARSRACSTAARREPMAVTVRREGAAVSRSTRSKRRNTVLTLTVQRRRRQVRGGDGDGPRRADQPAVAPAGARRLPARRPRTPRST